MSITYVKTRRDTEGLTRAIGEMLADGQEPRSFRTSLAQAFRVSLDDVDDAIKAAGSVDEDEMRLRNAARVYGRYDANPGSEHDEA